MKTKKLLLAVGRHEKGDFGVWVEDPETAGGLPVVCIFRGSKESCEKYINSFPIIKAAPALLEALKGMVNALDIIEQDEGIYACQCESPMGNKVVTYCSYCTAKAAIAQAEKEG